MPGLRFVTDSTADLDPVYREQHRILTVPLKVIFGDEAFVDGVDIDPKGFYAKLRTSPRNPTTSQPTPAEFEAAFRDAASNGDTVICTTISAEMSGTHGAALTAREAVADLDIRVIDTRTVAMGHYAIVRDAIELAESGAGADAVVKRIHDLIRRQRSLFTVPTLEYLRRGGRIGGARALLGSVLNIKPVLTVLDGRVEPHDRVRTNQRALERIAEELVAAVGEAGIKARAVVGHADKPEDAQTVLARIRDHCDREPVLMEIGPIVGTHAGPGCIGLSFYLPPR